MLSSRLMMIVFKLIVEINGQILKFCFYLSMVINYPDVKWINKMIEDEI